MALATFFALFLILASLVYFWIKRRYSFCERNGFLYETPSFPFGNLKGVGKIYHPVDIVLRVYNKFKGQAPAIGIYFFLNPVIFPIDLDLIKDVLIRDFDTFHNRGLFYNKKDDPLSAHLLTIEDEEWKSMRGKLTQTFTSGKMKMMFSTLLNVSNHMITKLKSEKNLEKIEIKEVLSKYTTDVIGNVAFGLEMNAIDNPDSEFRKMGKRFFGRGSNFLTRALFLSTFRPIARKLGLKLIPPDISAFFYGVVKATVNYRLENKIERNDFLNLLMNIKDDYHGDDGKLTIEEIAAQCFVFFIGGFESSSSTGTFVLYNLAMNQNIQEKLRGEIKDVLARHKNEISYEAMQEMKYLQMVVEETLRMFPPIFQLIRVSSYEYKIPNTDLIIPKGTQVMIPVYSIHHDSEYYPEPEKFDPERFNEENKANRHPMAFIPFGSGNRNCIGFRFGLMQTKLALIQLLINFRILPTSDTPLKIKFDPTIPVLASSTDMWLKIQKL